MKNEIVYVSKKDVYVSSITVAELLDIPHNHLLRTIESIVERQKQYPSVAIVRFPQIFKESTFVNKMNRTYKCYEMNEQAYMKLAMHLKGYDKAEIVQDSIIEAFSLMKTALLNHQNSSWLSARNQLKAVRLEETDVIKDFVEYCKSQGSQNSENYYRNITKMTNKALELLVQSKHGGNIRDLASIEELGFIQVVENRARQAIEHGMQQEFPYKFIYKYAKDEVNILADALNFKKHINE